MISIGSNGQRIAYGIKHYNLDDISDLEKIIVSREKMGCTCFVINTSKYYMLNGQYQWVEITPFGKIVSSDGSEDPDVPPGGDGGDDTVEEVIYEGGTV